MNCQWKKINKRSGNIKRACKKKYQQILASNPEIVCSNFNGSRPDTTGFRESQYYVYLSKTVV